MVTHKTVTIGDITTVVATSDMKTVISAKQPNLIKTINGFDIIVN